MTSRYELIINKEFFADLNFREGCWILLHEIVHSGFQHSKRGENKVQRQWNIAADAVTNKLLSAWIMRPSKVNKFAVDIDDLAYKLRRMGVNVPSDFTEMSAEEIYKVLMQLSNSLQYGSVVCEKCNSKNIVIKKLSITGKRGTATMECKDCGYKWVVDVELGSGSGTAGKPIPIEELEVARDLKTPTADDYEVIQSGDQEVFGDNKTDNDIEEKWKEEVAKAYTQEKMAGHTPAGLKRMIDRLLGAKLDWRSLLRQAFHIGMGKTVVSTWARPSRKHPSFPGIRRFTLPTVRIGVDTSGSVSRKELTQFLSEVSEIVKRSPIEITFWDARAYKPVQIRNRMEMVDKVAKAMRGWGGTSIGPWLRLVNEHMKLRDIVVVLTDGEIFDMGKEETKDLFSLIASKASTAIFVTTAKEHDLDLWHVVRLEVD